MRIEYVKQVPPGDPPHRLVYEADGDVLRITHVAGEVETVDVFDFTDSPDGELDVDSIETSLPVQPILAAERSDGILTVTALDWRRE